MRLSNFGLVYALEPVSCIYDALVANIINNAKHGVIPVKLGLGIVDGSVQIKHSGHTGGTPSLNTDYGSQITEQIGLISLESAFFSDIDTVVMDIEGYEFDCLMNLKFVHESICSIFVELHPTFYKGETSDLINKMYNLGFKASYIGQRNEQNHVLFKKIDI
jgi:FkbM family methyltransferase